MSLPPEAHLGPYELLWAVGAGGVREGYEARDSWLEHAIGLREDRP